jgi:hypothetical protein
MSRWKYKTDTVTVGENSQAVRMLTAGERKQFAQASQKIKAGEMQKSDLPALVAKMGCTNPTLSEEELEAMPPDLLDACVSKIMELTGFKAGDDEAAEDPEKKET